MLASEYTSFLQPVTDFLLSFDSILSVDRLVSTIGLPMKPRARIRLSGYDLVMEEAEKEKRPHSPGPLDCLIVGAGPGGLQAAIYLCRYGRNVLILDRGGGRTRHAKQIENFLSHQIISGQELIERGLAQAQRFGAREERETVISVEEGEDENLPLFLTSTANGGRYRSRTVIVSSGAQDALPRIGNLHKYVIFQEHSPL